MESSLLKEADVVLSKCGGRKIKPQTSVVPIYRAFLMPMLLQPNQSQVFSKEITGETTWSLRAISSDQTSNVIAGVRMQIQLPNGRFVFGGNGIDVGQFAWIGSFRFSEVPEVECQPASRISVTLTDTVGLGSAFACNLLFEGAYNYYLRNGRRVSASEVSQEDRYQGIINENILAPCYVAGFGPSTPPGFRDDVFTYSSPSVQFPLTGPLFATVRVPIDAGLDFQLRKLLVDITKDSGVTAGIVLGRPRAGAGYALCDDLIDMARYIGGAEYPHDWHVRGGDAVYFDLQLADFAGVGNVNVVIHLEGVKRRRG